MAKNNTSDLKWLKRLIPAWGVIMVAGLILTQNDISDAQLFSFRFNSYALISLFSVLVQISFILFIYKKREEFKSNEIAWYILFVFSMILFGFFEMLQRLSASPEGAIFWAALSGIGPAFLGVGLLIFTLQYTRPNAKLNSLIPMMILFSAILYVFFNNGDTLFINSVEATKLFPWGYNNEVGKAFILDFSWALGLALVAVVIMARFRTKTKNIILKKQAGLFVIAISIPIVGALIFDALAPIFGLHAPPLADLITATTAGLMLYALTRYKLFSVTPASMSSDIFSTMTESVVVTDKNLQIKLMNDAARELFNIQNLDSTNASLIDFFGEEDAKKMVEEADKITNASNKHIIGNFVLNQNTNLRISAVKITEEHGLEGYIFAISDITELHQSYLALEKEKNSVEQKVELRTRELRAAQERLAETDKIKTEFVILTSHNLRTPLTTIRGSLEFLEDSKLNESQKKFVTNLQNSSKRLSSLVEELLTISEIEAGNKAGLKPLRLTDIIEPLLSESEDLAKANNNKFIYENSAKKVKVNANSARLVTAIHNLLDNAFKFTKNGEIHLKISSEKGRIKLEISDNGIGIKETEIPKLFTKFHRGTSVMQYDYEGEGIGLYLAKLIIDEHKGRLQVASELGKGTTFTIELNEAQ